MFFLDPSIKKDPVLRWNLKDRTFFGHGGCHILAHAFLDRFPGSGFRPFLIRPAKGFTGSHIFVTDGIKSFDYRGYVDRQRLIDFHFFGWSGKYPGWRADLVEIDKCLISNKEMAELGANLREPDQFLHDPLPRAHNFISKFNHSYVLELCNKTFEPKGKPAAHF